MKKVCGLDVHKDSILMCILDGNSQAKIEEYSTLIPDIERLRDLFKVELRNLYWVNLKIKEFSR